MFAKCWKIWNLAQINLSSALNFYRKYIFRRNNIHREIDHWNRRRFGAKWHVTVPNSVPPVKPIVCKLIYMSQRWCCQVTQKMALMLNFHPHFRETVILSNFYKINDEKCSFLSFSTTRVKRVIWNQHISVNVHVAYILINTIILKKRN